MQLWTIPVEIIYYFFIPIICLCFKLASCRSDLKAVFLVALSILCYAGCNYNILGMDEATYAQNPNYNRNIRTCFMLTVFVFVTGSLIGFLLHSIQQVASIQKFLDWKYIQLLISLLSIVQFCQAYKYSMWPKGEVWLSSMHIPGFQWGVFLFLLLLNSSKWNLFVAYLENDSNLQVFGKYSFGVYLNHYVAIYLISKPSSPLSWINKQYEVPEKLAMILFLMYCVGWLWYSLLEKPLIILANELCKRLENKFNSYQLLPSLKDQS